jgi:hypothetical protein
MEASILAATLLSTIVLVFLGCGGPSEAQQRYEAGVELQKQGQLEGAVQEYNEALRLVGFEYGEEVIYSPYWESVPKAGTRIVVRFGDVQYSGVRDAYSLAKDLMAEAARLSAREFDERLFNRTILSRNPQG